MYGEIAEYPYRGTISSIVQGKGMQKDDSVVLYSGKMDLHTVTEEEGRTMQTSSYIVSIPLTKDGNGNEIIPKKGDKISVSRYGEIILLTVDNSEPSQLGGVSIYASRSSW